MLEIREKGVGGVYLFGNLLEDAYLYYKLLLPMVLEGQPPYSYWLKIGKLNSLMLISSISLMDQAVSSIPEGWGKENTGYNQVTTLQAQVGKIGGVLAHIDSKGVAWVGDNQGMRSITTTRPYEFKEGVLKVG